jgi:lipoate-protein ligase A
MLCIDSHITDPFFNLASEEFLLKNKADEIFMIWQSDPVVVSGKHQNVLSEINYRFVKDSGIHVARRLTGGGTVFHDSGNINFTFIRHGEPGKLVNFSGFIDPVIRYLRIHNIEAKQGSKHEILVNDRKISGNAEHVYKDRVLHHGTLLFDTDMTLLHRSIKPSGGVYTDKSVQSNRSSVINLSDFLNTNLNQIDFRNNLCGFISNDFNAKAYNLNDSEKLAINKLAEEKYRSWDWIFGWSPDYSFRNTWESKGKRIIIEFSTHRGIITEGNVTTNIRGFDTADLNTQIRGIRHHEEDIRNILLKNRFELITDNNRQLSELVSSFF